MFVFFNSCADMGMEEDQAGGAGTSVKVGKCLCSVLGNIIHVVIDMTLMFCDWMTGKLRHAS